MMNSLDEEVCTIKLEANTVLSISQPADYLNFRVDQFKICVNDFVGCKLVTSEKYVYFMQTIVFCLSPKSAKKRFFANTYILYTLSIIIRTKITIFFDILSSDVH